METDLFFSSCLNSYHRPITYSLIQHYKQTMFKSTLVSVYFRLLLDSMCKRVTSFHNNDVNSLSNINMTPIKTCNFI